MNATSNREHEFADRNLRGDLNAEELADFERLLNEDSAARERFRRATRLDANLGCHNFPWRNLGGLGNMERVRFGFPSSSECMS
jgi:hypothetical protein